jgi:hypothetical protein
VIGRVSCWSQLLPILLSSQPVLGIDHDTKAVTTSAPKFLKCPFLQDSWFQKNCSILRTSVLSKNGGLQKERSYLLLNHLPPRLGSYENM